MLIKITNHCAMGCSHCMEKSIPKEGLHMSEETFAKTIKLSWELEKKAYALGLPPIMLLSGGECTDHPQFEEFVDTLISLNTAVICLSHGMWLADPEKKARFLKPEWDKNMVMWQITNDPRFYPTKVEVPEDDPRLLFIPSLTAMLPLGRFSKKDHPDVRTLKAPGSFNFRSLTRHFRDVQDSVAYLRMRSAAGGPGWCTPSFTHEGNLVAGESNSCWKIGDCNSTVEEITKNVLAMGSCNRCGLEDGLDQKSKRALGLTTLFMPGE